MRHYHHPRSHRSHRSQRSHTTYRSKSTMPPIQAFTLVELMVVIAILLVLIALAMPVLQRSRRQAMAVESASNLRQLALANLAYASDHGVYVPADHWSNNLRWHGARSSTSSAFDPTRGLLSPYLGDAGRARVCPFFKELTRSHATFEEGSGGYGYNAAYVGGRPGGPYASDTGLRVPATQAQVALPESTLMFATTALARSNGIQEYPYAEPPFWDFGNGPTSWRPTASVHFRVNGKALVAWCDGHVTTESPIDRPEGSNPYGGNAEEHNLGWFGPDAENGFWNPSRQELFNH